RVEGLRLATALDAVGDVLGKGRPVLEAVARAAAEQPPAVLAGVAVEEEVRVGRQVVLANAGADERRAGERREPPREVGARGPLAFLLRPPLEGVGVDLGAGAVPGELQPEPAELAVPVVGARVVAEGRRPGPAAVDAGVEDVAAR